MANQTKDIQEQNALLLQQEEIMNRIALAARQRVGDEQTAAAELTKRYETVANTNQAIQSQLDLLKQGQILRTDSNKMTQAALNNHNKIQAQMVNVSASAKEQSKQFQLMQANITNARNQYSNLVDDMRRGARIQQTTIGGGPTWTQPRPGTRPNPNRPPVTANPPTTPPTGGGGAGSIAGRLAALYVLYRSGAIRGLFMLAGATLKNIRGFVEQGMEIPTTAKGFWTKLKEIDKSMALLSKNTSTATKYHGDLFSAFKATYDQGVTLEEVRKIIEGLHENMVQFSGMAPQVRKRIEVLSAQLGELGVTGGESSKLFDIFTTAMHKTGDESVKLLKGFANISHHLDIPLKKSFKLLGAQMDKILVYNGRRAMKVFTNLLTIFKKTGIEVSSLTAAFGKQMDTFEGSSQAAGKLNAMLGSNISTMQLLNASEEERFMIVKKSLEASGKTLSSMSKWDMIFLKKTLGLTKMADVRRLFLKGSTELDLAMTATQAKRGTPADPTFKTRVKAAASIDEKLKGIGKRFLLFGGVMGKLIKQIRKHTDTLKGRFAKIEKLPAKKQFPKAVTATGKFIYKSLGAILSLLGKVLQGVLTGFVKWSNTGKILNTAINRISSIIALLETKFPKALKIIKPILKGILKFWGLPATKKGWKKLVPPGQRTGPRPGPGRTPWRRPPNRPPVGSSASFQGGNGGGNGGDNGREVVINLYIGEEKLETVSKKIYPFIMNAMQDDAGIR